ncbi:MAG TPA: hypothetical protein VIN03_27535 [Roseateles sp.]
MVRRTPPRWLALALLLVGGYVLLLSLGFVEAHPRPGARRALLASPRHGSVTLFGLALLSFALNIGFPMAPKRWLKLSSAFGGLAFVTAMLWFIWFTGMPTEHKLLFSAPLALVLVGAVWIKVAGVETIPDLDALEAAQVLRQHGRPEQADEVLLRAIRDQPWRAEEFQRALEIARRQRE